MSEDVYTRLREFMDTLPGGYPTTPSGVEIKILKRLFTPEQAELTMKLGREPEEVQSIAARTGTDETELAKKLEELALKGCIFRVRDGEKRLYQAYQPVHREVLDRRGNTAGPQAQQLGQAVAGH